MNIDNVENKTTKTPEQSKITITEESIQSEMVRSDDVNDINHSVLKITKESVTASVQCRNHLHS